MIRRYTRPEMGALFNDQHRYETWLAVELAVCAAWASAGEIPQAALERIRRKARFDVARIDELEATLHHDVLAFTTCVGESIGADSAYFHRGLTSSDVVDTAQSLILREAGQLIEVGLLGLKNALGRRAVEFKHSPCIGRTHGVHAEPTTFGLRLLVWYDELARHEERLAQAIDGLAVGKLSGAVGNFAHIPPQLEEDVLARLNLRPAPVSNQVVQRDRHAHFISVIAGIAASMEKIAINLRTLQRTEIGEVQEPFLAGQKGSSAMPHKKNPILLERISGFARVIRGYSITALENVALWDERDISHSGAERIILTDACVLIDYALHKLSYVVENMEVRTQRMLDNIFFTRGLVFSQRVMLALTQAGLSREQAYSQVQRHAMRCWEDGTPLMDALLNDREVRASLSAQQITSLFDLAPYAAHVDSIFARVGLGGERRTAAPAPPPEESRGRGRGRGRERQPAAPPGGIVRGQRGLVDAIATGDGAYQNITERPELRYDSAELAAKRALESYDRPDETLGEAEHQKRLPKKRASERTQERVPEGVRHPRSAQPRRGTPPAPAPAGGGGALPGAEPLDGTIKKRSPRGRGKAEPGTAPAAQGPAEALPPAAIKVGRGRKPAPQVEIGPQDPYIKPRSPRGGRAAATPAETEAGAGPAGEAGPPAAGGASSPADLSASVLRPVRGRRSAGKLPAPESSNGSAPVEPVLHSAEPLEGDAAKKRRRRGTRGGRRRKKGNGDSGGDTGSE